MSWNTLMIVVRDRSVADLTDLGWRPVGSPTTGDEAATAPFDGVAAVAVSGGVLLLNPAMELVDVAPALASALGTEVVTAMFAGVADGYWWRVDGPGGLLREWGRSVEDTPVDEGDPLPEEAGVELLDEDALFGLLEARVGLGWDWVNAPAQPLLPPGAVTGPLTEESAPASVPERRGFWARLTGRGP